MKKIISSLVISLLIFSFSLSIAAAHEGELEGIALGKQLVESKAACNTLDNDQLEAIGDYIMEQMHPGEQHEVMENMMGGDGSETVKLAHIKMAQHMYCGNYSYGKDKDTGMMNGCGMMSSRTGITRNNMMSGMMNMMGSGMIENNYQNYGGNKMAYGMMSGYGMMGSGMLWLNGFLCFLLLIGLVVLVWLLVFKAWNDLTKKGKK